MKFVKISHICLRGLIQLRNDLVHYISSNRLPSELKNEERVCSKCSHLRMCSLLRDKDSCQTSIDTYDNSIDHLTEEHKNFFHKWYEMLEHEFGPDEYKQFEAGELVWWKSQSEMETTGLAVFDLRLNLKTQSAATASAAKNDEFSMDRFFPFEFQKTKSLLYHFK